MTKDWFGALLRSMAFHVLELFRREGSVVEASRLMLKLPRDVEYAVLLLEDWFPLKGQTAWAHWHNAPDHQQQRLLSSNERKSLVHCKISLELSG